MGNRAFALVAITIAIIGHADREEVAAADHHEVGRESQAEEQSACDRLRGDPDLNRDGMVDILDLVIQLSLFGDQRYVDGTKGTAWTNADINMDRIIDSRDIALLLAAWGPQKHGRRFPPRKLRH